VKKQSVTRKPSLVLSSETVRNLQSYELRRAAGGLASVNDTGCPTDPAFTCTTAGFSICYHQCGAKTSERG
jgi:hypothetical protein